MKIERIVCGDYQENAYLVDDRILIDPGDDLDALRAAGKCETILLTHGHFDHMLAAEPLQKETGAEVWIHESDEPMLKDEALSVYNPEVSRLTQPKEIQSKTFREGDAAAGFTVLHTPGHTSGSVCFYKESEGILFSGDTLFRAGFGRTDMPGGSRRELYQSLMRLLALPDETVVYPGHGEATTIGEERRRYGK